MIKVLTFTFYYFIILGEIRIYYKIKELNKEGGNMKKDDELKEVMKTLRRFIEIVESRIPYMSREEHEILRNAFLKHGKELLPIYEELSQRSDVSDDVKQQLALMIADTRQGIKEATNMDPNLIDPKPKGEG